MNKLAHIPTFLVFAASVGCNPYSSLDSKTEYKNLSYAEFQETLKSDVLDPTSKATNIFLKSENARDESDVWMRFSIDHQSASKLFDDTLTAIGTDAPNTTITKLDDTSIAGSDLYKLSSDIPEPLSSKPIWWTSETLRAVDSFQIWVATNDGALADGRSKGNLWAYDKSSGTILLWYWSRQHR